MRLLNSALLVVLSFVCAHLAYAQIEGAAPDGLPDVQCPSSPQDRQLELEEVSTACAPGREDFCAQCSCALFSAFKPELRETGLFEVPDDQVDESALAEAVTRGAAVITQCVQDFIPQFIAGGVQVQALANLAECSFEDGSAPQCLIDRVSEEIPDSDLRDGASPAEDSISQEDSTSKEGSGGEEGRSGTAAGPGSSFTEEEGTEGRGSGAAVGTGSSFTEEEGTEGGGPDATGGKDKEDLSDGSDAAAGGDGRTGPESEGSSAGGGGTAVGGDGTPAPEEGSSGSTRDSEPSSSPEGDDTGGGSGGSTGSGTGSGTPPTGSSALSSAASSLMPLVAAAASSLSLLAL